MLNKFTDINQFGNIDTGDTGTDGGNGSGGGDTPVTAQRVKVQSGFDIMHQLTSYEFTSDIIDDAGEPIDLSEFTGVDYCIFDYHGDPKVKLTLGSGVSITNQNTKFKVKLTGSQLKFQGIFTHQLKAKRTGQTDVLVFKRRLRVEDGC